MRGSRGVGLLLGVGALVVTAACGTQLPDSAFPQQSVLTETIAPSGSAASAGPVAPASSGASPASGSAAASPQPGAAVASAAPGVVTGSSGPAAVVPSGAARTTRAAAASGSTKATGALTASDRGVTATTITIGNIVSAGGIFGSEQFGVSKYGIQAYVSWINAHGGIDGRKVILETCNDNGDGSQNVACVKQLVDDDKVFALVGNNIYAYDGVTEVQSSDTPDILGQQISNVYTKYSHLYTFGGTNLPRNNKDFGFDDSSYGTSELGHFYHDHIGGKTVGVVYYDQQSSKAGADLFGQSFAGGYTVKEYAVNLGLPNFSNTVAQMQADGVDVVGDALDDNGNEKLCQAMEGNAAFIDQVKAKITTVGSSWNQRIPVSYKSSPKCRNLIVAGGVSRSYSQTSDPDVATFRAEMKKDFPQREALMAQWSFEAWIAGEVFTQAAQSCGAALTRTCLEGWMVTPDRLIDPGGDTAGMSWDPRPESYFAPGQTQRDCVSVARWSDSVGTWVPLSDIEKDCYTTPFYKYSLG